SRALPRAVRPAGSWAGTGIFALPLACPTDVPDLELRALIHLALHVLVPLAAARVFWPRHWRAAAPWLLAGWLLDVDHLLADPVYAPGRCSIGLHPLHTWPAMAVYAGMLLPRRTRWLGTGLVIHILLDALDCVLMRCS